MAWQSAEDLVALIVYQANRPAPCCCLFVFVVGVEETVDGNMLLPNSWFAWECLAFLRLSASDFQGAESAARMSVSFFPPVSGGYGAHLLAIALLKQGHCTEALPYAQATVGEHSDAPHYLLGLGDVYWCLGDTGRASQVYRHLEEVAPNYAPYVRERINATE